MMVDKCGFTGRRGYLEDLFYLSSNMLQSFTFSKEHYVLGRCADVFESGSTSSLAFSVVFFVGFKYKLIQSKI